MWKLPSHGTLIVMRAHVRVESSNLPLLVRCAAHTCVEGSKAGSSVIGVIYGSFKGDLGVTSFRAHLVESGRLVDGW